MEHKFISYDKKYFDSCATLIKETWPLHKYFKDMKDEDCVYKSYLKICLVDSVFSQIIINDDDNVIGLILGSKRQKTYRRRLTEFWLNMKTQVWILSQLMKGEFGQRKAAMDFAQVMQGIQQQGQEYHKEFDSEIILFIVGKEERGKKLGYSLMNNYIKFCKENNIKSIYLWTDLGCTYSFYDRFGFKLYKKFHNENLTHGKEDIENGLIYHLNLNYKH